MITAADWACIFAKKLMQNMNGDIFAESGNDQMTVTAVFFSYINPDIILSNTLKHKKSRNCKRILIEYNHRKRVIK